MFLFAPGPGLAQSDGSPGASSLQFQGSVRTRVEVWNWFEGEADHSYVYSGSVIRFGIGQQTAKRDWKLEFSVPILLGLPDDAIAPAPQGPLGLGPSYFVANKRSRNAAMVFPKQGYLRFHHLGAAERHGPDHVSRGCSTGV